MIKLTDNQKEFLLNYFFKNDKYIGWKNIGTTLLETGECIVAGTDCIWVGGIGNFIKTETTTSLYKCLEYKFDLIVRFIKEFYLKSFRFSFY